MCPVVDVLVSGFISIAMLSLLICGPNCSIKCQSLTLGICRVFFSLAVQFLLWIFRFSFGTFFVWPFVRAVTYVFVCVWTRMCAFICVIHIYEWRGKKALLTVILWNPTENHFISLRKEKNYNILIIQLIVWLLSMAIFYYTKNKWMTGWMNEWMKIYTQHGNDDDDDSWNRLKKKKKKIDQKNPTKEIFNSNAEIQLETYGICPIRHHKSQIKIKHKKVEIFGICNAHLNDNGP